jgi:hypothetical protein
MSPLLDDYPQLCPFSNLGAEDNKLMREISLTNQEGKHFFATCLEYFIDMSQLEAKYSEIGCFAKYYTDSKEKGMEEAREITKNIIT